MIVFFTLHRGKLYIAGQSVGGLYNPASATPVDHGPLVLISLSPSPAVIYLS